MKKRPLCAAALAVILLLWLLPKELWMEEAFADGRSRDTVLTGEICRMEPRENGQAVYLKNSSLSDTGIILVYLDADTSYSIGNTIQITGAYRYQEPEEPANPGQFDARLYYQTKHIPLICYAKEAVLLDGRVRLLPQLLYRTRRMLGERCLSLLGERQGGVMKAMLLGDKSSLSGELQDIYQKSGMSHLLAISGLHISIFGMSLYRLLRRAGASFLAAGLPAAALVLLYGSLTGMGASTARAVVMFLLAVAADILGRSYDMLSALSLAALLLLLEQPLYARNASFLLSFGAVLGIGVLYPVVSDLIPSGRRWSQAALIGLCVQAMTLPLVQRFYYQISPYSTLLNLFVAPLMGLLMLCGTAALPLSCLSLRAVWLPALLCRAVLRLFEGLGSLSLKLPGACIICGEPKNWQIAVYYLGLAALAAWRCRKRLASLGIYLALAACLFLRLHSGLTFTMLDVGQGDSLFLRTQSGTACLIDGGSSSVKEAGAYRIIPFLKEQGVGRLDYVAVTHTDQDHISGMEELILKAGEPGEVQIGTLLLTEQARREEAGLRLWELALERGIEVCVIRAGDSIADESTRLVCLHPARGESYGDTNGASMVFQVLYGDFSMLLTGDLGEEGEQEILNSRNPGACDVLKAGHHGSKYSTSAEWLEAVSPRLTLISCGQDNSYGHPHAETIKRLREADSQILITAELGAITIRSDGKRFWAEGFKRCTS